MRRGGPQREFCVARGTSEGDRLAAANVSKVVHNPGQVYLELAEQAMMVYLEDEEQFGKEPNEAKANMEGAVMEATDESTQLLNLGQVCLRCKALDEAKVTSEDEEQPSKEHEEIVMQFKAWAFMGDGKDKQAEEEGKRGASGRPPGCLLHIRPWLMVAAPVVGSFEWAPCNLPWAFWRPVMLLAALAAMSLSRAS